MADDHSLYRENEWIADQVEKIATEALATNE